jgi:S1-C subfamily serine protease
VIVVRTMPNSPAARAGLRGIDPSSGALGDIIVGANGIAVHRLADLTDEIEKIGVGHPITLNVRRGGSTISMSVDITDIGKLS